jgi:protein-L-isoaspartate(D-aspartate) O-methyltransferase
MLGSASALAVCCLPAEANVPVPYDWNAAPPMDDKLSFIEWMVRSRGEEAGFLGQRWDRFRQAVAGRDLWDQRDMRAFLLTPREHFVTNPNLNRAYGPHPLGIGYGVTISDPHIVARMTSALNVVRGDRALEVGTGSGYQSAYLANLTDKVWSIEIIKPLAERTRRLYDSLIERGYDEYKSITTRHADGYYGWEQEAPFDKVIVTCAIDHIPPPLLQQMKPNGMMVIPVAHPARADTDVRYGSNLRTLPMWGLPTAIASIAIARLEPRTAAPAMTSPAALLSYLISHAVLCGMSMAV